MNKLYHLSQTKNNNYDTYDSCIVCAKNPKQAKTIHPDGRSTVLETRYGNGWVNDPKDVTCKEVGIASDNIVIGAVLCSSFNAG